jgi:hypothetical protein
VDDVEGPVRYAWVQVLHHQWSRLKSSMPFKRDLAFKYIPLSKEPFQTQPQLENEDIT